MKVATLALVVLALLLSAAIFGFFYAWVCSTMWGLDAADPRVAIAAMQAMNASVRNAVFAPAFFGTPIALIAAAAALWMQGDRTSGGLFACSAAVYFGGGLVLTMLVNVPMNTALAAAAVPVDADAARQIWADYSPAWQVWNQTRTVASGLAFVLALVGVMQIRGGRCSGA